MDDQKSWRASMTELDENSLELAARAAYDAAPLVFGSWERPVDKLGNTSHAVMQQRHEAHDSLISCAEAKRIGQTWYFTGRPCVRGHVDKRSAANGNCRSCDSEKAKALRQADPERVRAKERRQYWKHVDKKRKRSRAYRDATLEERREYDRKRYQDPERRAWQKQQALEWAKANPGKRNHIIARRRWWIKRATPRWLTAEQREEIRQFYLRAKAFGPDHHVDHIVPLRGRNVCGLNVPWNLQILTKAENIAKGNRF